MPRIINSLVDNSLSTAEITTLQEIAGGFVSAVGPSQTYANALVTVAADVGKTTRLTDVGPVGCGSLWISDGTRLRPLNGEALYCSQSGTKASPLATLSGATGKLTLSSGDHVSTGAIALPVGLPAVGQGLRVEAKFVHRGTGGTWNALVRIGTTNSASDNAAVYNSGTATDDQGIILANTMEVVSTTSYIAPQFLSPNSASAGGISLKSTNFDITQQVYVGFYCGSLNAADFIDLISYRVWIVG